MSVKEAVVFQECVSVSPGGLKKGSIADFPHMVALGEPQHVKVFL
jgi:hypothetical protein